MGDTGTSGDSNSGKAAKVSQACVRCRQKKSRCDGNAPSCSNCVARNEECVYRGYQRRRGPGRSKQHVRALEKRLWDIETLLQRNESTLQADSTLLPSSNQVRDASALITEPAMQPTQRQVPAEEEARRAADTTPDQDVQGYLQTGVEKLNIKEAVHRRMPLFKMVADNRAADLESPAVTDSLRPVPGQHIPVRPPEAFLIQVTIQEICDNLPLFDVPSFKEWAREPETLKQRDKPSQWACLNAVTGLSILLKSLTGSYEKITLFPWAYMKNAYSVLPEVMLQRDGVCGVQAVLVMVMFMMRASGDARAAAMLLSIAVPALHTGCLRSTNRGEDETKKRVFWAAYVLDAEISLNCGMPPLIHDEDIDLPFPSQSGSLSTSVFALRAELATLQARIRKQLYSIKAFRLSDGELIQIVAQLASALDSWRTKIPIDIQPGQDCQPSDEVQTAPTILLQLVFYNCVSMVHWAVRRHSKRRKESVMGSRADQMSDSRIREQAAAKAVVQLLPSIKGKSTADVWLMLPYILSAALSLLDVILEDPSKMEARLNLKTIETLVSFLEALVANEGMCFSSVVKGFVAIREAARHAVNGRPAVCFASAPPEYQSLKVTLDGMTHPMFVAQALLGNIPNRDTDVGRSLSDALSIPWEPESSFSPWVPQSHRPETYGFKYDSSCPNGEE